jgi:hypothetical protein
MLQHWGNIYKCYKYGHEGVSITDRSIHEHTHNHKYSYPYLPIQTTCADFAMESSTL